MIALAVEVGLGVLVGSGVRVSEAVGVGVPVAVEVGASVEVAVEVAVSVGLAVSVAIGGSIAEGGGVAVALGEQEVSSIAAVASMHTTHLISGLQSAGMLNLCPRKFHQQVVQQACCSTSPVTRPAPTHP